MQTLTIQSVDVLEEELQNEVHHTFGMEHYTDYVFHPRSDAVYSATIVLEESEPVIAKIISASASFPEHEFMIEDLDMEQNSMKRYRLKNGKVIPGS
ncbi:MAG TPA: hypothetical protein ENO20_02205 [Bacteroides sp.]|nr:hypothetical protein [Bacteroides sp.]